MMPLSLLFILLFFGAFTPSFALNEPIDGSYLSGPLYMYSAAPFQLLRYNFIHENPYTTTARHWRINLTATWANTWAYSDSERGKFVFDQEQIIATILARYAFTDRIEAGVSMPFNYTGGGVMDGFIEGFHRTFGLGMMRRDDFPRNKRRMEITHNNREITLSEDHNIFTLTHVYIDSKTRLLISPLPVAVKMNIKIPVDSTGLMSRSTGLDFAFGLSTHFLLAKPINCTLSASATYFQNNQAYSASLHPTQYSILAAFDFLQGKNSWLIQCQRLSPITSNLGMDLDHPIIEVILGFKRYISKNITFEFGLIENILHFENSADFGIHCGISIKP